PQPQRQNRRGRLQLVLDRRQNRRRRVRSASLRPLRTRAAAIVGRGVLPAQAQNVITTETRIDKPGGSAKADSDAESSPQLPRRRRTTEEQRQRAIRRLQKHESTLRCLAQALEQGAFAANKGEFAQPEQTVRAAAIDVGYIEEPIAGVLHPRQDPRHVVFD